MCLDITNGSLALLQHLVKSNTPVPLPASAWLTTVTQVMGDTMMLRLTDAEWPSRRARPDEVAGASVFSFIGHEPSLDLAVSKFEAIIGFDASVALGLQLSLMVFWFNRRMQSALVYSLLSTHVGFGGVVKQTS